MITGSLQILSLLNGAAGAVDGLLGDSGNADLLSAKAIEGVNGEELLGDFSSFLSQNGEELQEQLDEVAKLLNTENTEGEISAFLSEKFTGLDSSLDDSTKSTIQKLLDGSNVTNTLEGDKNVNANQNLNQRNEVVNGAKAAAEKVVINEDTILDKKDLNLKPEIISTDSKFFNPLNKNLGIKEDERIMGKDNLQSMVKGTNANITDTNSDLLGLKASVVGDKLNATQINNDNIAENLKDAGKVDPLKIDVDINKQDFTKFSNVAKNNAPVQQTLVDGQGNYKIVNVTKSSDGIELKLEPISLGKVSIKMEITAEGKTNLIVVADKQETLDILKNDSKSIQKILSENGMETDSGSLSFDLNQGNNGDQAKKDFDFGNNGRDIAFNLEQELNENIRQITPGNINDIYRNSAGAGLLNMVV